MMKIKANTIIKIIIFFCLPALLYSEDILTAGTFFEKVSDVYGNINDFQGKIKITSGSEVMEGEIFYKSPNLIRINFFKPETQVIVADDEKLVVYIPSQSVIMQQDLSGRGTSLASMTTKKGLKLLQQSYSIAFLTDATPVPLDETNRELVTKLKLAWKSTREGFRNLEVSIDKNKLIRRIEGITSNYQKIRFDFFDIIINQNIPRTRFDYESPASANIIGNFLFEPEG